MRPVIGVLLFAAVGLLTAPPAHGTGSASVTVNGTTRSPSQSGFLFEQVGGSANLEPTDVALRVLAHPIPEPSVLAPVLSGLALLALGLRRRDRGLRPVARRTAR